MRFFPVFILLQSMLITACQPLVQTIETAPHPAPDEPVVEEKPSETGPACPPSQPAEPIPETTSCPVCPVCPAKAAPRKQTSPLVIGALEKVRVEPPDILLTARIDTGAKSSSIHAANVVRFEREGERWASFDISDDQGKLVHLEMPIERRVRITQANNEIQRRYVVRMWLTLGNIREKVDVTLADRAELTHPLLIGRNFLVDTAIVDVSKKFTQ